MGFPSPKHKLVSGVFPPCIPAHLCKIQGKPPRSSTLRAPSRKKVAWIPPLAINLTWEYRHSTDCVRCWASKWKVVDLVRLIEDSPSRNKRKKIISNIRKISTKFLWCVWFHSVFYYPQRLLIKSLKFIIDGRVQFFLPTPKAQTPENSTFSITRA